METCHREAKIVAEIILHIGKGGNKIDSYKAELAAVDTVTTKIHQYLVKEGPEETDHQEHQKKTEIYKVEKGIGKANLLKKKKKEKGEKENGGKSIGSETKGMRRKEEGPEKEKKNHGKITLGKLWKAESGNKSEDLKRRSKA